MGTEKKYELAGLRLKLDRDVDIPGTDCVSPYYDHTDVGKGLLPLFAPPQTVDKNNWKCFYTENVNFIMSAAYATIHRFNEFFCDYGVSMARLIAKSGDKVKMSLSTSQMSATVLASLIEELGEHNPDLEIMAGTATTPGEYEVLSNSGAEFVRIGNGREIANVGGFPLPDLISECYERSFRLQSPAKILAQGEMTPGDAVKALAMGADYVMPAELSNVLESAVQSPYFYGTSFPSTNELTKGLFGMGLPMYRNGKRIEHTLTGWLDDFKLLLQRAMFSQNTRVLDEFVGSGKFYDV